MTQEGAMKNGLPKVVEQLQQAGGGLTDDQLLARFVSTRDEESFAALLRRHGSMVFGVCRRVLANAHDAEDAFQATFLILARRAASVVKREAVGCYLYAVAYHTALEAARAKARRCAREKQVKEMPHPEAAAVEEPDWLPLLDRELNRLSDKYRDAIVLCDLEGHSRKEAARLLGVAETTLSSRVAKARKLLARRLSVRGVGLPLSVIAATLATDAATAQVPGALVYSTARVASLVAAGQLTAVSKPAAALMKGVMKVMLVKKLKLMAGVLMVATAVGAIGLACRPGDEARAQSASTPERVDGRPQSEVEALRKRVELLEYNLQLVLEKSAAQERELRALRGTSGTRHLGLPSGPTAPTSPSRVDVPLPLRPQSTPPAPANPLGPRPPIPPTPAPPAPGLLDGARPLEVAPLPTPNIPEAGPVNVPPPGPDLAPPRPTEPSVATGIEPIPAVRPAPGIPGAAPPPPALDPRIPQPGAPGTPGAPPVPDPRIALPSEGVPTPVAPVAPAPVDEIGLPTPIASPPMSIPAGPDAPTARTLIPPVENSPGALKTPGREIPSIDGPAEPESTEQAALSGAIAKVEAALKTLRGARGADEQQRAARALESATRKLREQILSTSR